MGSAELAAAGEIRATLAPMSPADLENAPSRDDLEDALALLVEVFHDDPFYVWFEPNEAKRPAVLAGLLSFALAGCAVHVVRAREAGRATAVLAWHEPELPPSNMPTRGATSILGRALRSPRRAYLGSKIWDEIKARRPRDVAHVVVELFAVERASRGRGNGRALLDALLARADKKGWIVHLETTRPENVAIYERFGFRAAGEPIVRGSSVPTFCLRRSAAI